MNRYFLIPLFLSGQWLSCAALAQSQPASRADSSPFATSAPLFGSGSGPRGTPAKAAEFAADQLCYSNGWDCLRRGDNAGAELEFTRLIQLRPTLVRAYASRANARRRQQDFTGALADCTRAIELDPDDPAHYRSSAVTQMLARRWTEASADLQAARLRSPHDNGYPDVLLWIVRMRLGETDTANEELAAFLGRPAEFDDTRGWVRQVGRFLLNRETEADLLQAAASKNTASNDSGHRSWLTEKSPGTLDAKRDTTNGPLCEAWFYSGMKRLLTGDKGAAAEHFRQCLATKQPTFIEYELAAAELREMER